MQLTKEARINYWNEHIKNAALHEGGIHGYSQENKISKSALYRWKEYFSNLNSKKIIPKSKASKKRKQQSPFMPVIVEAAELKSSNRPQKNNLPDARWVAEIITQVIQGLA